MVAQADRECNNSSLSKRTNTNTTEAGGVRGVLYMCIYHMTHTVCTQYIFNGEAGKKERRVGEITFITRGEGGRKRGGGGEGGRKRGGGGEGGRGREGERELTMRVAECRRSHLGSGSR